MAVHQARHFSHDFPAAAAVVGGGSLFLDEYGGCAPTAAAWPRDTTALREFPRSDLNCDYGFVPRKRPRLAAGCVLDDQRVVIIPAGTENPVTAPPAVDVQSRAVGSCAASTSGRAANGAGASRALVAWMHHQGVEIDALVRLEAERLRAGLEEARRRHARALLAAAGRLRAAEAEAGRALRRNAELEEKARQAGAECQAWMGVARSHEAVAAGLRATLDQLILQSSPRAAAGDAEDARSCCFEAPAADDDDSAASMLKRAAAACRACGGGEACVRAAAPVPAPVPVPRVRGRRGRVPRLRRHQERLAPRPLLLIEACPWTRGRQRPAGHACWHRPWPCQARTRAVHGAPLVSQCHAVRAPIIWREEADAPHSILAGREILWRKQGQRSKAKSVLQSHMNWRYMQGIDRAKTYSTNNVERARCSFSAGKLSFFSVDW